ncbi:hypothetical protein NP572_05600 [Pseudomonas putida]|uniref:hypothetical protein n=1 Tax=Pseudomonas putida TaxID=303 RepID=UPI0023649CD3|nr:hypothetical protein [Pseudomonas putida]MDD2035892.1 hypothetical protein [Pseudomonas putida]MDD2041613.1 hypothetical protein [Pseudomonas putida]
MEDKLGRSLFLSVLAISIAGCDAGQGASKLQSICSSIILSTVVDPSSVSVNSSNVKEYELSEDDLLRFYSEKFRGAIPPATQRFLNGVIERKEAVKQSYVEIDYTASDGVRKYRDKSLCWFVNPTTGYELATITIRGIDYDSDRLLSILLKYGRPSELDVMNKVK